MLQQCIEEKEPEEFVLTRKNGLPVRDFRERWDQIVAEAKAGHWEIRLDGTKTWYPAIAHDLRRTAITNMLAGGMPKEMVQSVVGHLSDEMTERYCQPRADMLRRMPQFALANRSVLTHGEDVTQNSAQSIGRELALAVSR